MLLANFIFTGFEHEKGVFMSEVSFKSTFRIPITQQGINKTKKTSLKALVNSYGGIVGTGNTGYACVSMPNSKDTAFLRKLKGLGYKVYQMFEGENIKKNDLSDYIKKMLTECENTSKNALKKNNTKIQEPGYKRYEFGNWEKETNKVEQDRIRNTDEYKNAVKKYGEEAAEAMYFFSRKEKI